MKANEAPEKIYLFENPISNEPDNRWLTHRSCDEDVEYIRTDAFIEKAEVYLKEKLLRYIDLCERGVGISTEEFIEEFKNYMKGK